ncbi:S8 family peptidase [Gudongella sp. SC589]|uniref:S8 family peptidase n=1 Tax=Gudongella sp. SC589 TaxID=3385990 RepID=UPI003904640C
MIEQNKEEFEKANIITWHEAGFKGKGGVVVVLDDNGRPHEHTRVIEPFNDSHDKVNHKTNVCSVIREVAPDSAIYAFNWFAGHKEEIVAWIKEHELEIDAINCSFSGRVSMDVFEKLEDVDIPIITASGNSGYVNKVNDVARYNWTIAVGAWLEHNDQKASYSNSGEDLDIVSYTNIFIPTSDGYDRLMYFNGTSCAAPMVSGMIAIYNGWLKENGLTKLTREDAKAFVIDSTIDKDKEGFDVYSGHGLFVLPESIPEIEIIEFPKQEVEEVAEFKDTKEHWAREYIEFVADKGLMKGYEDGSFQPNKPISRAEVATIIARLEGFEKK